MAAAGRQDRGKTGCAASEMAPSRACQRDPFVPHGAARGTAQLQTVPTPSRPARLTGSSGFHGCQAQRAASLPWIIPLSFQVPREFPQDTSALLAILTPLSKLQMEILAGMFTSTVLLHLGSTKKRQGKHELALQAERKRGCTAGKQVPSDKETIPAGRTRFQGPSYEQLLHEQGCKSQVHAASH